jgi:hypothetical protein
MKQLSPSAQYRNVSIVLPAPPTPDHDRFSPGQNEFDSGSHAERKKIPRPSAVKSGSSAYGISVVEPVASSAPRRRERPPGTSRPGS